MYGYVTEGELSLIFGPEPDLANRVYFHYDEAQLIKKWQD